MFETWPECTGLHGTTTLKLACTCRPYFDWGLMRANMLLFHQDDGRMGITNPQLLSFQALIQTQGTCATRVQPLSWQDRLGHDFIQWNTIKYIQWYSFFWFSTSIPVVDVPGTVVEQAMEEMCSPLVSLALIGVCWVQILIVLMALLFLSLGSFQHFRQTLRNRRCEKGFQDTPLALLGVSDCVCAENYDCSSG